MGKKARPKRNRTEAELSDPVMNSTSNSDTSVNADCQKTNAENIIKILEMVQSINVNMETLKQSVFEIQNDLGTVKSRVMVLENKSNATDNEIATVKSEFLTLQSIVKAQSQLIKKCNEEMNVVVSQSLVDENRDKLHNLLFWGLNDVPLNEAASRVSEVIVAGLSLPPDKLPPFTVVHCSKNFVKIRADSVQARFLILSNAKKLKGKEFGVYKSVFISDDVSPRVRVLRKELLGLRKRLADKGVECWVPPTLPPSISVKKDNRVIKVPWYNAKSLLDS